MPCANAVQGRFTTATFAADFSPSAATVGDFNGDGKVDLAVTDATGGIGFLFLLMGNGDGTFADPYRMDIENRPLSIAASDFNGDGSFAVRSFAFGTRASSVVVADLNNDTKPDLGIIDAGGFNTLLGQGNGTFLSRYAIAATSSQAVLSDFNGDGNVDLAFNQSITNSQYAVGTALGNGDGTFATAAVYAVAAYPKFLSSGDFDGDDIADLAAAATIYSSYEYAVSMFLCTTSGPLGTQPIAYARGVMPLSLTATDFDNDGRIDLAVGGASAITFLANVYGGTHAGRVFATAVPATAGGTAVTIASGDFNGDGKADLATVDTAANRVLVRAGYGDGTFAAATSLLVGTGPTEIASADFNHDGKADLAVSNTIGGAIKSLVARDVNHDARPDLIASDSSSNTLAVLQNMAGTFPAVTRFGVGAQPTAITTADLNGDTFVDLVTVNSGDGSVSVLLNRTPAGPPYATAVGGMVTLSGTAAPLTVSEAGGVLSIASPAGVQRLVSTAITGLVLSGVNVTVASDLGRGGGSRRVGVVVDADASVTFNAGQHLTSLVVNGTAALTAGGNKLLRTSALTLGPAGVLLLSSNFGKNLRAVAAVTGSVVGDLGHRAGRLTPSPLKSPLRKPKRCRLRPASRRDDGQRRHDHKASDARNGPAAHGRADPRRRAFDRRGKPAACPRRLWAVAPRQRLSAAPVRSSKT